MLRNINNLRILQAHLIIPIRNSVSKLRNRNKILKVVTIGITNSKQLLLRKPVKI
jgi:hypothetical protein